MGWWEPESQPVFYSDPRMHVFRNDTQLSASDDSGEEEESLVDGNGTTTLPLASFPEAAFTVSAQSAVSYTHLTLPTTPYV